MVMSIVLCLPCFHRRMHNADPNTLTEIHSASSSPHVAYTPSPRPPSSSISVSSQRNAPPHPTSMWVRPCLDRSNGSHHSEHSSLLFSDTNRPLTQQSVESGSPLMCSADNSAMLVDGDVLPLPVWIVERRRPKATASGSAVTNALSAESSASSTTRWYGDSSVTSRGGATLLRSSHLPVAFGGALDERIEPCQGTQCTSVSSLGDAPHLEGTASCSSVGFDHTLQPSDHQEKVLPVLLLE